jgi:hypothetical protein
MRMPRLIEVFSVVLKESLDDLYNSSDLRDKFSKTYEEFKRNLEKIAEKYLGKDWKDFIEKAQPNKHGDVDKGIRKMWIENYTDYEAIHEIGFWYDLAQTDSFGAYGALGSFVGPKMIAPDFTKERTERAVDVDKDGNLVFDTGEEIEDL